jgi:hypothetical protein
MIHSSKSVLIVCLKWTLNLLNYVTSHFFLLLDGQPDPQPYLHLPHRGGRNSHHLAEWSFLLSSLGEEQS